MLKLVLCVLLFPIYGLLAGGKDPDLFNVNSSVTFNQNEYKVEMERFELVKYNPQYIKNAKLVTFKYNRTCPVVNFTFTLNVELGNHLEVVVQVYKFMSNEYRLFPLRVQINACEAIAKNVIGISAVMKCGKFTGCPLRKGITYHICYWTIDQAKFPPLMPNGRYMAELQGLYLENEVGIVRGYATVSRPIV